MKNVLLLILMICATNYATAQTKYLHCGKLIDGVSNEVKTEMTIVVEGNKIIRVANGYLEPKNGVEIIDLKSKTVLPGLMDCHVHLEFQFGKSTYLENFTLNEADVSFRSVTYAKATLDAGFTTVRDLGGSGVNVALRNAINQGYVPGPRIYTAAKSIAITGGHADPTNGGKWGLFDVPGPESGVADGVDECRKAVRQQVKNGADLIKITATGGVLSVARDGFRPQFTEAEIAAIIETANDFGIAVAAHAHGDEGMRRAVAAGISSIEHGTMMSEATMDLMIEKGTYYVPTITAGRAVADSALIPRFYPEMVRPKALFIGPQIQGTFEKAHKRGVKIAFGTDAGVFQHGLNALEFQYMVESGMSPMSAIQSATMEAAKLMRIEDKLGSIETGKLADIIAVDDNPIENIETLMKVIFVMKDGVVYK
ncbi:MAG: amidohydrolase family protein [Saprospiraceae bacterium]|nr:amidohydrolase family protein [Saprospiraceae bacterium]